MFVVIVVTQETEAILKSGLKHICCKEDDEVTYLQVMLAKLGLCSKSKTVRCITVGNTPC